MEKNDIKSFKRMLMLSSVASMIDQFNMSNIEILMGMGYSVDVACNFEEGNSCSKERIEELKAFFIRRGIKYFQIDFTRCVFNLPKDIQAYKQIKSIVKKNQYDFIHCHSPIGGVIGRIVAHQTKTKVIYTAHGFHFYNGAPKKNWMFYYPIEKWLSRWTDVLVTINREDYNRAKAKLHAKKTVYIPGIGIDIKKFTGMLTEKEKLAKRLEIGIPEAAFVILSVGELNANKNHQIVIKAISQMSSRDNVYYLIAGKGEQKSELEKLAKTLNVNVCLLGYRKDISDLYEIADLFVHPSYREGMSVAVMEAVAAKKVVVASRIRGSVDLINSNCLFSVNDTNGLTKLINESRKGALDYTVSDNFQRLEKYSIENIEASMCSYYQCVGGV